MVYESFLGKKPHNRYFIFNKCVTDPIQLSVSHHLVTRRRYGDHSHSKASVFNGLKALLDRSLNKVDRFDRRYDSISSELFGQKLNEPYTLLSIA